MRAILLLLLLTAPALAGTPGSARSSIRSSGRYSITRT